METSENSGAGQNSRQSNSGWKAPERLLRSGYPLRVDARTRRRHNTGIGSFRKPEQEAVSAKPSALQVMCEKNRQKNNASSKTVTPSQQ